METVGKWIGNGINWLVCKGAGGVLYITGTFCRFMITECEGTFVIFALAGGMVYIMGGSKTGMKMIRTSFVVYLIMGFLGVIL